MTGHGSSRDKRFALDSVNFRPENVTRQFLVSRSARPIGFAPFNSRPTAAKLRTLAQRIQLMKIVNPHSPISVSADPQQSA